MYWYTHVLIHLCIGIHMYSFTYVLVYTYTYSLMYWYTHVHIHLCISIHIYTFTYVLVYTCTNSLMYCVCILTLLRDFNDCLRTHCMGWAWNQRSTCFLSADSPGKQGWIIIIRVVHRNFFRGAQQFFSFKGGLSTRWGLKTPLKL